MTGEDENYDRNRSSIITGREWDYEHRWWYKPAHICRRWRNLILGSASFLGLYLVCTLGTPVADMLAHSLPIPLVIDYRAYNITAKDEEGIFLALEQSNRIRSIRLKLSFLNLQKFAMAIKGKLPILEYLVMASSLELTTLVFPKTIQAPHLRHLILDGVAPPIGSLLLTTAMGLVTLRLVMYDSSNYLNPKSLLQWISPLSQLETLEVTETILVDRDVEMLTPTTIHTTLPNLRWLSLKGVSAYLEVLIRQIATPHLEKLHILFYDDPMPPIPCFVWVMNTTENTQLRFDSAKFEFSHSQVLMESFPYDELYFYPDSVCYPCYLSISADCLRLNGHISSMAQIVDALGHVISVVEHLILDHEEYNWPPGEGFEVEIDRRDLYKLLRPFSNVKNLCVNHRVVEEFSRYIQPDDGDLPPELLPELQELTYFAGSFKVDTAFTSFIDARQNTGHPVSLVRRSPT